MIGEQEDMLKALKNQIHLLMAKYTALKKDFGRLILENEELKESNSTQKERIEALEQQYTSARVASGVLVSEDDKEIARAEINRIVREIDNCIALLNR